MLGEVRGGAFEGNFIFHPRDDCRATSLRVAKLSPEFARKATINEEEEEFKVNSRSVCEQRTDVCLLFQFHSSRVVTSLRLHQPKLTKSEELWRVSSGNTHLQNFSVGRNLLLDVVYTFCPKLRHVDVCAHMPENNNSSGTAQDVWSVSGISGTQPGRRAAGKKLYFTPGIYKEGLITLRGLEGGEKLHSAAALPLGSQTRKNFNHNIQL